MDPITQRINGDAWQRAQPIPDPRPSPVATDSATPPRREPRPVDVQPPSVLAGDPYMRKFAETAATNAVVLRDARDVATQARLDAFLDAAGGPYTTPDGTSVRVTPPFQMAGGYGAQQRSVLEHAGELSRALVAAHLDTKARDRIEAGRGTLAEIRALTQALLDGKPRGMSMSATDVRRLMFDCGLGLDCAAYTQAAYLYATAQSRSAAGLQAVQVEDLSGLQRRGFRRVSDPADLRPGDLVVLGKQEPKNPRDVGHRAIVYDSRSATASEMRDLVTGGSARAEFAIGGPVRMIEVDSSWGSNGDFAFGGVQREKWFVNEATGEWAWESRDMAGDAYFGKAPRPYDHPLEGFFRKGE